MVVLDPGHNGGNATDPRIINHLVPAGRGRTKPCNTTGTSTNDGYTEAAFNWDVALRVRRLVVSQGATVVLTRQSNSGIGPCVNRRAAIGNRACADAVVSIHADGGPSTGRGFHVIYAPNTGPTAANFKASLRLAQALDRSLTASALLPPSTYIGHNGYSVRDDLAGLNLSARPAVFVELGNMRNPIDASIQLNPGDREELAKLVDAGLASFLTGG